MFWRVAVFGIAAPRKHLCLGKQGHLDRDFPGSSSRISRLALVAAYIFHLTTLTR